MVGISPPTPKNEKSKIVALQSFSPQSKKEYLLHHLENKRYVIKLIFKIKELSSEGGLLVMRFIVA